MVVNRDNYDRGIEFCQLFETQFDTFKKDLKTV